jgi:acylphosphatase
MRAVHLFIAGRVQGVGFRDWLKREAEGLGLHGWVRNRGDGRVEALAQGAPEKIELFVAACHQGPAFAHVSHVESEEIPLNSALSGEFRRLSTVS